MASKRTILGSASLLVIGAGLAVATTHIKVGWQRSDAAPAVVDAKLPPPSSAQVSEARSLGRTFAQVASQLSPSVVRISITKNVQGQQMGNNPLRFFFGDPNEDEGPQGMPGQKERGMGSGVVIDKAGYIVTNNHVVQDATDIKVTFVDGKTVPGKVVGTDPKTDIAVIKVEGVNVKPAKFGDSDKMQVGEWTIAIGNPMGLDHTVTVGVLSAKGRANLGMTQYEDFLQTDASINPGNSGGPLINLDGEIIGINTMIKGIGTGLNFAVSANIARPTVEQLIKTGKVHRPYIGVVMQDVTPDMHNALGTNAPDKGAIVSQVAAASPADKAGMKVGDIITRIDGQTIEGSKSLQRTILGKGIGQKIEVAVWRDGKEQKFGTTTAELPGEAHDMHKAAAASAAPPAKLGIGLQDLTPQISQQLELPKGTHGAVIGQVRPDSPAQEAGLQRGDLIVEVDRHAVASADDAQKLLAQNHGGGHLVRVQRGEQAHYVVVQSE